MYRHKTEKCYQKKNEKHKEETKYENKKEPIICITDRAGKRRAGGGCRRGAGDGSNRRADTGQQHRKRRTDRGDSKRMG